MNAAALELLLARYSVGARHLAEPAPDAAQQALLLQAALRAPDHGGLVPFRFVAVRDRAAFADLLAAAARDGGKSEADAAVDRERALRSPLTLAVVARIDAGHPQVPAHEQWAAVGGAIAMLLAAAQALGFGGKMLSGAKARAPRIVAAFCGPGEQLVGWIDLGTPLRAPQAKQVKPAPSTLLQDWPPRA